MNAAPIGPADALVILESLPARKSLAALRRELVRRGTPVSATTLRKWAANSWTWKREVAGKSTLLREARAAAERVGFPLSKLSDSELTAHDTRALLINAALLLGVVQQDIPRLMREDPRGLAAVMMAARRLIQGGNELMRATRDMAERSMRERLMLLPTPYDAHHDAHRDGDRSLTER